MPPPDEPVIDPFPAEMFGEFLDTRRMGGLPDGIGLQGGCGVPFQRIRHCISDDNFLTFATENHVARRFSLHSAACEGSMPPVPYRESTCVPIQTILSDLRSKKLTSSSAGIGVCACFSPSGRRSGR